MSQKDRIGIPYIGMYTVLHFLPSGSSSVTVLMSPVLGFSLGWSLQASLEVWVLLFVVPFFDSNICYNYNFLIHTQKFFVYVIPLYLFGCLLSFPGWTVLFFHFREFHYLLVSHPDLSLRPYVFLIRSRGML